MDIKTAKRMADLINLSPSDGSLEKIVPQLTNILQWVEQLSEVNTDGVEPMASPVGDHATPERRDIVTDGQIEEDILSNAPETNAGFFVVPKVVEQES